MLVSLNRDFEDFRLLQLLSDKQNVGRLTEVFSWASDYNSLFYKS